MLFSAFPIFEFLEHPHPEEKTWFCLSTPLRLLTPVLIFTHLVRHPWSCTGVGGHQKLALLNNFPWLLGVKLFASTILILSMLVSPIIADQIEMYGAGEQVSMHSGHVSSAEISKKCHFSSFQLKNTSGLVLLLFLEQPINSFISAKLPLACSPACRHFSEAHAKLKLGSIRHWEQIADLCMLRICCLITGSPFFRIPKPDSWKVQRVKVKWKTNNVFSYWTKPKINCIWCCDQRFFPAALRFEKQAVSTAFPNIRDQCIYLNRPKWA